MQLQQEIITIATRGRGPVDVTGAVAGVVRASQVKTGICTVFVKHTSASLLIQENADPAVLRDLAAWIATTAPESPAWEHDDEGPDDMPAHLRATLMRTSETIPIAAGELALGTWQALYLWEHRTRPYERRIVVTVMGLP